MQDRFFPGSLWVQSLIHQGSSVDCDNSSTAKNNIKGAMTTAIIGPTLRKAPIVLRKKSRTTWGNSKCFWHLVGYKIPLGNLLCIYHGNVGAYYTTNDLPTSNKQPRIHQANLCSNTNLSSFQKETFPNIPSANCNGGTWCVP